MKRQLIEDLKAAEAQWRKHEMGGHPRCRCCQNKDNDAAFEITEIIAQLESGKWDRDTLENAIRFVEWVREERRAA